MQIKKLKLFSLLLLNIGNKNYCTNKKINIIKDNFFEKKPTNMLGLIPAEKVIEEKINFS
jgi:hypothetical protein